MTQILISDLYKKYTKTCQDDIKIQILEQLFLGYNSIEIIPIIKQLIKFETEPTFHDRLQEGLELLTFKYCKQEVLEINELELLEPLSSYSTNAIIIALKMIPYLTDYPSFRLIKEVKKLLDSENAEIKYNARISYNILIKKIAEKKQKQTITEPQLDLFNINKHIRIQAIKLIENKDFIPSLIQQLNCEKDNFVKSLLIKKIGSLSSDFFEELIPFLKDTDGRVRSNTIEILEKSQNNNIPTLIFPFLYDADHRVRTSAVKYLLKLGNNKAEKILKKMIKSNDEWIRRSALHALDYIDSYSLLLEMLIKETMYDIVIDILNKLLKYPLTLEKDLNEIQCVDTIKQNIINIAIKKCQGSNINFPKNYEELNYITILNHILHKQKFIKSTHYILLEQLNSPDYKQRKQALTQIQSLDDQAILHKIITMSEKDPVPVVRFCAKKILNKQNETLIIEVVDKNNYNWKLLIPLFILIPYCFLLYFYFTKTTKETIESNNNSTISSNMKINKNFKLFQKYNNLIKPSFTKNIKNMIKITEHLLIDDTEVTNQDYAIFIKATNYPKPKFWHNSKYNNPLQPVVGISWYDAFLYAKWANKRLPTEKEWLYATNTKQLYAWGNQKPDRYLANYNNIIGRPTIVSKYPPNKKAIYEINGNVMEWLTKNKNFKEKKPLKGGSWNTNAKYLKNSNTLYAAPYFKSNYIGFRCITELKGGKKNE